MNNNNTTKAIFLIIVGTALMTALDAVSKALAISGLPASVILFLRFAIVSAVLISAFSTPTARTSLYTSRMGLQFFRGAIVAISVLLFVFASRDLPLTTMTSIFFFAPLALIGISYFFLGESVAPGKWLAVSIGFIAVVGMMSPTPGANLLSMGLVFVSALLWAGSLAIIRLLQVSDKPVTIMFWSTIAGTVTLAPFAWHHWQMPNEYQIALLLVSATLHCASYWLIIRAFCLADASTLAPMNYSTIIWAAVIGWLAFGDGLNLTTITGATVLIAAGLYVWWKERLEDSMVRI